MNKTGPSCPAPPRAAALACALLICASIAHAAEIPTPAGFLGRAPGEDRYLAPWTQVAGYFHALDAASDRISIEEAGRSTRGEPMLVAIITSPSNQQKLDRIREVARMLANPDSLDEAALRALRDEGRAIVLVTCTIHSTEVASTQMSMELAHGLATAADPATLSWLDEVVLLLMPSINPDGQVMVVDWYNKHLGTEHEGGMMPWLYHQYTGHDNNRDFYMLTQVETQAVNGVLYHRWHPQVYLDVHQMGSTGPRMFVPPQTDPLAPDVPSMIFRLADVLGTNMALRLEEAGKAGVGSSMIFDSYWPGGTRNTAWWKNVVGLLTETASARIATPIRVEQGELTGGVKGFPEYGRRANYPSPWGGGVWRLRDIMDYQLIATRSLIESCARHRPEILDNFARLGLASIASGRSEPPYAFIVPPRQHDDVAAARLVDLMLRHGVRVDRAGAPFAVGNATWPAGSYVIPAAQPYRNFLLTMLRPQPYPEVLDSVGGKVFEPYDTTGWSLPLLMGVDVVEAGAPLQARLTSIDAVTWPGGPVSGARGGWIVPHAADAAFSIMNRLLEERATIYWLEAPAGGAPGDIFIPRGEATPELLTRLSTELHAPVTGLDTPPRGRAWRVGRTRTGLYKPWIPSMDEGWTRFLLEQYGFPYSGISNQMIRDGSFARDIDVLLLPDIAPTVIKDGIPSEGERRSFAPLPAPYAGGIDKDGGEKLKSWVLEKGGTIVALGSSTEFVIELLGLPASNAVTRSSAPDFRCPGSLLRLGVDTSSPLGFGMRSEEAAYFSDSAAFTTRLPDSRFTRQVVAWYPEPAGELLLSGWLRGADKLARKAAVVDLRAGKGRVILIGFAAQHRAQPLRTFKLLFNALYLAKLEESSL